MTGTIEKNRRRALLLVLVAALASSSMGSAERAEKTARATVRDVTTPTALPAAQASGIPIDEAHGHLSALELSLRELDRVYLGAYWVLMETAPGATPSGRSVAGASSGSSDPYFDARMNQAAKFMTPKAFQEMLDDIQTARRFHERYASGEEWDYVTEDLLRSLEQRHLGLTQIYDVWAEPILASRLDHYLEVAAVNNGVSSQCQAALETCCETRLPSGYSPTNDSWCQTFIDHARLRQKFDMATSLGSECSDCPADCRAFWMSSDFFDDWEWCGPGGQADCLFPTGASLSKRYYGVVAKIYAKATEIGFRAYGSKMLGGLTEWAETRYDEWKDAVDVMKEELIEIATDDGWGSLDYWRRRVLGGSSGAAVRADLAGARPGTARLAAAASSGARVESALALLEEQRTGSHLLLVAKLDRDRARFENVPVGTYRGVLFSHDRRPLYVPSIEVEEGVTVEVEDAPACNGSPSDDCGLETEELDLSTDFLTTGKTCLKCRQRDWTGTLEATLSARDSCSAGGMETMDAAFRVHFLMRDVAEPGTPLIRKFKSDADSVRLEWQRFNHRPCPSECRQTFSLQADRATYVNVGRWLDDGTGYELESHALADMMPFNPVTCGGIGGVPAMPNIYLGMVGGQLMRFMQMGSPSDRKVKFTSSAKDVLDRRWQVTEMGGRVRMDLHLRLERN